MRVRALYKDANGVLEEVYSNGVLIANANYAPTAGPTISDTTPTEGRALTANPLTIVDADGTDGAVFTFQWQQSADGVQPGTISMARAMACSRRHRTRLDCCCGWW